MTKTSDVIADFQLSSILDFHRFDIQKESSKSLERHGMTKIRPKYNTKSFLPGLDPSLKDGLVDMPSLRNPLAGIKPSAEAFIQMVPPVIMMRTRPSGYDSVAMVL